MSTLSHADIAVDSSRFRMFRWEDIFGNTRPVEVEIGCGKAGFLVRRATAHPHVNFLGIEWASEFYRYAVDRMSRCGLSNVRLTRLDAAPFTIESCPRESISVLHVYHPDPWHKRRHHKRRLFQAPFVNAAAACLVPGGRWAIQTDHAEYFGQIMRELRACPLLIETPFGDWTDETDAERVETNFEIKYRREGREIYRAAFRRIESSAATLIVS
jgi:tRNA (guanine-N7-)-methyltransferase